MLTNFDLAKHTSYLTNKKKIGERDLDDHSEQAYSTGPVICHSNLS